MNITASNTDRVRSPINRVETVIVRTRLPREMRMTHVDGFTEREHVVVRVTNRDGLIGFGEASPLTFFTGETAEGTKFALDRYLGPLTLGRSPHEVSVLHRTWDRAFPGYRAAKCALDVALHDLFARSVGLTLADLLGGSESRHIPIYKAIGFGPTETVVREAEELWGLGLRTFKVKVGDDRRQDIENLENLRARFGDSVNLIVDANGAFRPQDAVRFLRDSAPYKIAYIEQPVPGWDIEGLSFVRANGGVPVMADESVYTLRDAVRLIQAGAVDLLGIKLIKTAGLSTARKIATYAEEFGVSCVVISPFDTSLGVSASAQLASTFLPPLEAQGLGTFLVAEGQDLDTLDVNNGVLTIPSGLGLGVEPDERLFEGAGTV
jgi:o-succinylbenzoate synthase